MSIFDNPLAGGLARPKSTDWPTTPKCTKRQKTGGHAAPTIVGMNRIEAFELAEKIGCTLVNVRRKGEVRITHPAIDKPCIINNRRKDASRELCVFLKRVQRIAK